MNVRPLHDRLIGQRIDEGEQDVQVLGEQIRGHRRLDVRDRRPAGFALPDQARLHQECWTDAEINVTGPNCSDS